MIANAADLYPALLDMARLAGDRDARRPDTCSEDRFGSLEAVLLLHDCLWEGRPHDGARARETTALVDAYMDAHRAARPLEARAR